MIVEIEVRSRRQGLETALQVIGIPGVVGVQQRDDLAVLRKAVEPGVAGSGGPPVRAADDARLHVVRQRHGGDLSLGIHR